MILGFILVVITLLVAGYSLKTAYIGTTILKDARPMFMAFFLLTALAVLEVTWLCSPEVESLSNYFITIWFAVEALLVGCIWWLLRLLNQLSFTTQKGHH